MRTLLIVITGLLTICGLEGCVHRQFEYDDYDIAYLDVVFHWESEPDAHPGSMSLYLFPVEGGNPKRYEFDGREGGVIRVVSGMYHAICVNSDEREVFCRNSGSHLTFEVATLPVGPVASTPLDVGRAHELPKAYGAENEPLAQQPPLLWAASVTSFAVNSAQPAQNNDKTRQANQQLHMYPGRIVETYQVTVKKINNVASLTALSATISGMSDGYLPGSGQSNDGSVTIPLNLTHSAQAATAEGTFLTFGHCPESRKDHKLMLFAILTDGSKYYYEFDAGDDAHNPPDENGVHHIVVELLNLPEPSGEGGSMSPTVEEWTEQNIDISM